MTDKSPNPQQNDVEQKSEQKGNPPNEENRVEEDEESPIDFTAGVLPSRDLKKNLGCG